MTLPQSEGLNLADLEHISRDEVDANLARVWSWRGPLYELYTTSLMLDYAPDFAKLHRWGSDFFGRPSHANVILLSVANIHSYTMLGWETGIKNEFVTLRRNGMGVEQVMELVMFTQLYAGMRGLGHVFRAVGEDLSSFAPPAEPAAVFPEGWDVDPEAFRCGLDLSRRDMTPSDLAALRGWYERTIGHVPRSIEFGLRVHPEFVKVNRAKWEVAIKTLPKQVVPYMQLRHHMITGSVDGLREAALLGRAWGISSQLMVQAVACAAMFFTGFEGFYTACDAIADLIDADVAP